MRQFVLDHLRPFNQGNLLLHPLLSFLLRPDELLLLVRHLTEVLRQPFLQFASVFDAVPKLVDFPLAPSLGDSAHRGELLSASTAIHRSRDTAT